MKLRSAIDHAGVVAKDGVGCETGGDEGEGKPREMGRVVQTEVGDAGKELSVPDVQDCELCDVLVLPSRMSSDG